MGQTPSSADGLGLPHSVRDAAVTALTGFQSARVRNQTGIPPVGTSAFGDERHREQHQESEALRGLHPLGPTPTTAPSLVWTQESIIQAATEPAQITAIASATTVSSQ